MGHEHRHSGLKGFGWFLMTLEFIWAMAWFGIMLWFNLDATAIRYEQSFFDHIWHTAIWAVLIATMLSLHDNKPILKIWFFLLILVGFTDSRGIVHFYRVLVAGVPSSNYNPFEAGYQVMTVAALCLTGLTMLWVMANLGHEYGFKIRIGGRRRHDGLEIPLVEVVEDTLDSMQRVAGLKKESHHHRH